MTNLYLKVKSNKTIVNGSLFSLFSFINQGFGFLLLLILANYILPAEYGYLNLFATVIMVLNYFISMSIEGYLSVAYFREGQSGVKSVVSCVFATSIFVASVMLLMITLLGDKISVLLSLPKHVLGMAVLISFFNLYLNLYLDYSRINEKVTRYGCFSCGNVFLNFILSIFLVKYEGLGWEGRVYAQTICCILVSIACIAVFVKLGYVGNPNFRYWKQMLLWGVPLIPHSASNFFRQGCDRYIINAYYDISNVGLFSFALTLCNIIIMVGVGFNQVNSVNIYKILGDKVMGNKEKLGHLRRLKRQIFYIYIIASLIIAVTGYAIVPIVLPKYAESVNYFIILAFYGFLYCLYFLNTNYLFYYSKTKNIMYTTFLSSILHLMLSLFVSRYSLYLTAGLYVFTQAIVVFFIRKMANEEIERNLK